MFWDILSKNKIDLNFSSDIIVLAGEKGSTVFGSLSDGVFEGKIVSPKGSYFVEKARHYFPYSTHPNNTFHSVIYHEDHVQDPYAHLGEGIVVC